MYCPNCKAEYREGFTICADRNVELADGILEEIIIPLPKQNLVWAIIVFLMPYLPMTGYFLTWGIHKDVGFGAIFPYWMIGPLNVICFPAGLVLLNLKKARTNKILASIIIILPIALSLLITYRTLAILNIV